MTAPSWCRARRRALRRLSACQGCAGSNGHGNITKPSSACPIRCFRGIRSQELLLEAFLVPADTAAGGDYDTQPPMWLSHTRAAVSPTLERHRPLVRANAELARMHRRRSSRDRAGSRTGVIGKRGARLWTCAQSWFQTCSGQSRHSLSVPSRPFLTMRFPLLVPCSSHAASEKLFGRWFLGLGNRLLVLYVLIG
jgi:hypothetical protein